MEIFLASASPEDIEKAYQLPISGVLTNSSILEKERKSLKDLVAAVDLIGDLPFGLQIASTQEPEMMEEFYLFQSLVKKRLLHLKIPYCLDAFKIVNNVRNLGIKTNLTGISTLAQACVALEADIDYLSIYVGRVTDAGDDGLRLLAEIKKYALSMQKKTKILAASIRNLEHFEEVIRLGADAVAIPYTLLIESLHSETTGKSISGFKESWKRIDQR